MKNNRFIVVVTQYNAEAYIQKCLDSVMSQNYWQFNVVVIDDCSTDRTLDVVAKYPVHLLKHEKRMCCGALNMIDALSLIMINKEDIIVCVSGDDYLNDASVLTYLNEVYQDDKIWMTYGQFVPLSGNYGAYCKPIPDIKTYRKSGLWVTSHLITFKKWLWDELDKEDLKYKGEFSHYSFDRSHMYPMLEMSGSQHVKFIERILYIYNDMNPTCVYKIKPKESIEEAEYFMNKVSKKAL